MLYLSYGVTTVRDVGASEDGVADLADRLNAGKLVGPRIFRCGPVLAGDPPGWPIARVIRDARDGIAAVEELASEGVDCIKVYNEIGQDAFAGISKAAREYDLPLVGIGVIVPGAFADILLLQRDPSVELSALREWQIVIANGRRYDRELLDEWLGEYERHFHSWFQRGVMGPVAALATGLFSVD